MQKERKRNKEQTGQISKHHQMSKMMYLNITITKYTRTHTHTHTHRGSGPNTINEMAEVVRLDKKARVNSYTFPT